MKFFIQACCKSSDTKEIVLNDPSGKTEKQVNACPCRKMNQKMYFTQFEKSSFGDHNGRRCQGLSIKKASFKNFSARMIINKVEMGQRMENNKLFKFLLCSTKIQLASCLIVESSSFRSFDKKP